MPTITAKIDPQKMQTEKGSPFLLSKQEWITVQVYVENALRLPTTKEQMKFDDIRAVYTDIKDHCQTWKESTYPKTVDLASDISNYGRTAKTYYGALNKLLPDLQSSNPSENTVKKFAAIVDKLIADVAGYQQKAKEVSEAIKQFMDQSTIDGKKLAQLYNDYNQKIGTESEETKNLINNLAEQREKLNQANKDYAHYVVVAATTATYIWVPFVGWIVGGTVAGVYTARATEAKRKAEEAAKLIRLYTEKLNANSAFICDMQNAQFGINQIKGLLGDALKVIEKIYGIWEAIGTDLENLKKDVTDTIKNGDSIIIEIGIDDAINKWQEIGKQADDYRVNAYVKFEENQPQFANRK
jgi:DNA repair exonuclease SbcCD ATPase subunit